MSVTFIPATVFDNPALLRVNPEYLAWLSSAGELRHYYNGARSHLALD
jgi:hypothetical protein